MELARVKRTGSGQDGARHTKKSSRVLCEGVAARYAIVKEMRLRYSIPQMCRVLGVSPSGYYRWLKRKPSKRAQEEGRLEVEIKAAHQRTRATFGPEKGSSMTLRSTG